jgi:hypothetical protein
VGTGFRKRSCSNNKLERDDDSKKSHPALGVTISPDKSLLADTAARRCRHARERIVNVGATF